MNRFRFCLYFCLSVLMLAACDARSSRPEPDPDSDAGPSDAQIRDATTDGGRDGAPTCVHETVIEVERNGEAVPTDEVEASGEWLEDNGREVFRVRLVASHDPIPEAIDDEYATTVLIDMVPSAVLDQRGVPEPIAQRVAVDPLGDDSADPPRPRLVLTSHAEHSSAIRGVQVEEHGFGGRSDATVYETRGRFAIRMAPDRSFGGSLTLDVDGRVPEGFDDDVALHIESCFEFVATRPLACIPGTSCGNDCIGAEEWACATCGELFFTHTCGCRPDLAPLEECKPAAAAELDELCGEEWWCNRQCAEGLTCTPDPDYGNDGADADAGVDMACHYATCQSQ